MIPYFSLVICTRGRIHDLVCFFDSLAIQTCTNSEVVLVDQSGDDLRSGCGLSLGRNLALANIRGSVVAFPDDDCAYPPLTLAKAKTCLENTLVLSGLSRRSLDFAGTASGSRAVDKPVFIDTTNIWRCAIAYTIFLRRNIIATIGSIDEEQGVGSGTHYQSVEEPDYIFRALKQGYRLQYITDLVIRHPRINVPSRRDLIQKNYSYAGSIGHVVRKTQPGLHYFFPHMCKPLVGIAISIVQREFTSARCCLQRARGRWVGFIRSRPLMSAK